MWGIRALKVIKVLLFTVMPLLPPVGYSHFESYQSIAIYSDPAPAQLEHPRLQSYQSITIYSDLAFAPVGYSRLESYQSSAIYCGSAPAWGGAFPPSKLPKYYYSQ